MKSADMNGLGKDMPRRSGRPTAGNYTGFLAEKFLKNAKGGVAGRHWLTFTGIALGVFALLTVSSVMNGFDKDMRQRIIGTRSEIRLDKPDASPLEEYRTVLSDLQKLPFIRSVAPVVRNELMLVKGSAMAATVSFGIDLDMHRKVSPVLRPVRLEDLNQSSRQWLQGIVSGSPSQTTLAEGGIILGFDLALSINASVGDTIMLISPLATLPTPLGLLPRSRAFRVEGIFVAGMPEFDRLYSYTSLSAGQFFSGYNGQIDHIDIRTANPKRLVRSTELLRRRFQGYRVENWSSFDTSLYNAMHFEKYLMLTILGLMFVIASFNMSGNIYRTIVQKRRTIGVLKTIGSTNAELMTLFMKQGMFIAVPAVLAGIGASLILLSIQARYMLVQIPVGNLPNLVLPVNIRLTDYLVIPLVALLISALSIYIPARKAAKINPVDLIREIV